MTVTPPPYRIYLLRHAKAGWAQPGGRDFDRELTEDGHAEAEAIGRMAAARGYRPSMVISSTAARCRQTAEAMRRALGDSGEVRFTDDLYNCPAETYFDLLERLDDVQSVMIVGHNPAIEEVLAGLAGSDAVSERVPMGYPTAGLAVIDHSTGNGDSATWRVIDFLCA
ncbi:histidine phosphatase family protein [Ciceribacter sp. L1K23]|uniref:SixA phosphatase family protein n=1 Tax=Ciceribacter sp. L1K23 TaxID=2820276 RepID=UPI001B8198EE|nr:histidine phosphatase family protein [Ciceribacter sp. L1K23]MBR0555279.1 histidine phosphatase family protein [Ciceribacter sp. L1K23]